MGVWLGNLCLSSSWLFLSPILTRHFLFGITHVFLALVLNIVSLRSAPALTLPVHRHVVCGILLVSSLTTPFPYNVPFLLIAIGFFIRLLFSKHALAGPLENGFFLTGCILLVQAALVPFYMKAATRLSDLSLLAYPAHLILELFGIESFLDDHFLFVRDSTVVYSFSNDIGKFGLYLFMNVFAGALVIILLVWQKGKMDAIVRITFSIIAFIPIRYAALILFYLNYQTMAVFINPWILSVSLLPLAFLYSNWFRAEKGFHFDLLRNTGTKEKGKICFPAVLASAAGLFLIVGALGFNDPGKLKKGRVLINEKNSEWEWTTQQFDKNSYGQKALYNYYCLSYYIQHFYTVETNYNDLTLETLKTVDTLIIKMPTEPFKDEEVDAITDFVKEGGALLLIGDHTNVFGTSGYLNQLSERFGVRFNYDATYDLISGNLSFYEPPILLPHPAVKGLPPFLFGTSCTLSSPIFAEDVITGYQLLSVDLDYAQKNFFSERIDLPISRFGVFLQCTAIKLGKGRVLAFSDSTVFSNFWMFMPGKAELILGILDWLNRENLFPPWTNALLFLLGIVNIATSLFLLYRMQYSGQGVFQVFLSALFALPVSLLVFNALNSHYYKKPEPTKKYQEVFFDLEHSNMPLPVRSLVHHSETSYESFFILSQRLGYLPSAKKKFKECLKPNALVVIVNPGKEWSQTSLRRLRSFVEQGGKLLVLDSRCNTNSSANSLLESFEMRITFTPVEGSVFTDAFGTRMALSECATPVQGGQRVLSTLNNEAILSITDKGKGRIAVISDSHLFSDRIIGTSMSTPNSYQKSIFELGFWIFKDLMFPDGID